MKDCHIHLMPLIGPEDPPAVFMAKAAEAGVAGGTIMSLPPVSFRPDPERSQHWRDRLEHIMQYPIRFSGSTPRRRTFSARSARRLKPESGDSSVSAIILPRKVV